MTPLRTIPPAASSLTARRGLPLLPTLVVLIAVPAMLTLGFWQLERRAWKEALLADLAGRQAAGATIDLPAGEPLAGDLNFRSALVRCVFPASASPVVTAGRNLHGASGYSYLLPCDDNGRLLVNVGWAARPGLRPAATAADAGTGTARATEVAGMLVRQPARGGGPAYHLIARDPLPPLEASAPPSVDSIPNNHLSYAVQWFAFAAALSSIYLLYVRRWRRGS